MNARTQRLANKLNHHKFPMAFDTPCVAIDFDDTLAEYIGWRGPEILGEPREDAVWALKTFKHNGYDVEIHTNRGVTEPIWKWVEKYAPGTVIRINETREMGEGVDGIGEDSIKPRVDFFIDDRDWRQYGEELVWGVVMKTLEEKGLLKEGLLPR